ncbi:MAG: M64 family metallopeptidase [Nanoarchaeota archaeon]|nr:M64 family metallopeptidase [Nanoarchaeota archaeon]MBU1004799.1 M64 family metallopeptidase [Nanoarchaeota archaeon]MBU1946483.1 M64 family metallopeptidase [Nanoarchaeota archaeon]
MKKAQLTTRPIINALFGLAAVMILVFGTVQIIKWTKRSDQLETINFFESLQNVVKVGATRSFGSVDEKSIAVPLGIETLCFVDKSKNISPLVNCNLNYEINKYPTKNVFFEPFDKLTPIEVEKFELGPNENPICLKTVGGVVKMSLTSKGTKAQISTFKPAEKEVDCVSVLYNSNPNKSVDIVFLGYGYTQWDSFIEDVNSNIQTFLTTEPFKSNKDKINFYRVDRLEDLDCEVGSWIKCDEFSVKKLASYCPNDYIIILVDRNKVKDLLNPVRSSAVSNMEKINTADNKLVVLHEMGHLLGGLADEYVDDKYYGSINFNPNDYPNCDLPPECTEWNGVNGTGCFEGCSLGRYSRPTENSLMRSLSTEKFGPLNENIIVSKIIQYGER